MSKEHVNVYMMPCPDGVKINIEFLGEPADGRAEHDKTVLIKASALAALYVIREAAEEALPHCDPEKERMALAAALNAYDELVP